MPEELQITLLGSPSVTLGDRPVTGFVSSKAQALVYYLAATGQSHTRDALAGLLWSDVPDATAKKNLRDVLSNLRRLIGPYLLITRQTVCFNPETPRVVDSVRFSAVLSSTPPPTLEDMASLSDAVALYQGEFLAGFYVPQAPLFEEWVLVERQHLRQELESALERLVHGHSARGEYKRAIACAQRWLSLDSLREAAHRSLMRLHAWDGDRAAALRQYQACVQVLEEELGVGPAAETTTLFEQIRDGELEIPVSPLARLPEIRAQPPSFLDAEAPVEVERPVFVAREHELARLNRFLETALEGKGQVVCVTGGAGRGKTALIQEFARRALDAHPDMLLAAGNCNAHAGVGDPYLPFREALGMLTCDIEGAWAAGVLSRDHARRLWSAVPQALQALIAHGGFLVDTFIPGPTLLSRAAAAAPGDVSAYQQLQALIERNKDRPADLAQQQLFDQYTDVLRALSAHHPLLLLLDDLQWADTGSTGLLFHLGRRLEGSRILVAIAYRPDEVAAGRPSARPGQAERHPLEKVLAEFKRTFGDVWIDLAQADQAGGRRFVDAFLETEPNRLGEGFRSGLFRHTQGHALFTIELLRTMQERGDLVQDADGFWVQGPALDWEALPARVEAVIEERIGRLEDELRDILSVASVEGEDFTAQVVARVQGADERQFLHHLSQELEKRHRLVQEQGEVRVGSHSLSRYRFAHALFQQYLYNGLSSGERRLLHRATAEVLEGLYEERTDEIAVQLAHHWERAEVPEKATEYLLQAGDQARTVYAHRGAIDYYQRALALLKEEDEYELAARTLMKLGLTYHSAFAFQRSRQAYDEGFALWQRAGGVESAVRPPPAPHALRVVLKSESPTLDPGLAWDLPSFTMIEQLFSGLVEESPEMSVVPDVARSWEMLDGGRKYVFHLRDDVRWSDGAPVTAGDFEYAWKRVLDPASGSRSANLLYDIQGARVYHQGEVADPDRVGVRAIDETTLVVELEGPTGHFLHLLAHGTCYPVPRHVVEAHGEAWTEAGNIVTNGPFRLAAWKRGEPMVLERNPAYYGRFTGNLLRVELSSPLRQPARVLQIYEDNRLETFHFAHLLPPADWDRARQRYAGEYVSGPALMTFYIGFDVSRPPFDDRRVRRAFALATDRETLADVAMRGYISPATGGFVPPGMPGHSPGIGLPYDPEGARYLLAEAGYPDGCGFPVLESLAANWPYVAPTFEYLQARWMENLGTEITCKHMKLERLLDRLFGETPSMFLLAWIADYPDPDNFLRGAPWRVLTGWQSEAFDGLVEGARRVMDQEKRMRMYQQADRILVEEAPILPLFYSRVRLLVKPWVKKFPVSPLKWWFWKDVVIEPH